MGAHTPERIGRYRVDRVLGIGGFGIVVHAEDEELGAAVAVKILDMKWTCDQDVRTRFVEEARLLRSVRCDHLVTVHDIGELDDGRPYFVMDLADRGTLADRLGGQRGVDPVSLRAIINALADAIAALHDAGFVHRDVTPGNLMIKRMGSSARSIDRNLRTVTRAGLIADDERIVLGDLGLAKDFEQSAAVTVMAGTPQFHAPEQVLPDGQIGPATDVYGATAVIWATLTGEAPPPSQQVEQDLHAVGPEWHEFMRQGMAEQPDQRFAHILAWQQAATAVLEGGHAFIHSQSGSRFRTDLCPYQGLAAFQADDVDRFFGRDELVHDLIGRLRSKHHLVVGGASGSGKSSLVRAGLIPAVRSGALPDSNRWPVTLFTPGAEPLRELHYQLVRVLGGLQIDAGGLGEANADRSQWRLLADRITETAGGMLLCIDQFEELFTFDHSESVITQMLDALAAISDSAESQVRLVLVIRADFYGKSSRYPWLAQTITDNQVLVGPMSRSELREAITEPARRARITLDNDLIDAVLDEGASAAGSLPLVSHALAETWKRRTGNRMTLDHYRASGGVAGAIGQTAEDLYQQQFDRTEQDAARRLVLRLISPGDGVPDTRRPISVDDLQRDTDPQIMLRVTDALVDARLLTIDQESIQLAHEAIIISWPRLRDWINESRDDLRVQQRIEHAAAEWEENNRNQDLLYHGTPLAAALEWQSMHARDLNVVEQDFLAEAAAAEASARAAAEAASRRSRHNRRIAFVAMSLMTVAALMASAVALTGFRRARSNEIAANHRFAQSLASQAIELANENPRLALALSAEVIERADPSPVEARIALVNATAAMSASPYVPAAPPKVVGDALTVAVHPLRDLIITGNRDGTISLWDTRGNSLGEPLRAHRGAVEEFSFLPDGSRMVSAGLDGSVLSWRFEPGVDIPVLTPIIELDTILWSVALSPDGKLFGTASEDGQVNLFDIDNPGEPQAVVDLHRDFISIQFSPDGALMLAGNGRGELWSWRVADGQQHLEPFNAHRSDVWEIVFHPDGNSFATASSDGRVRLWETRTGNRIAEPFNQTASSVRGVQFDQDGLMIGGDENGRLLFWNSNQRINAGHTTAHHFSQVIDMSMQKNGMYLASLGFDQVLRTWRKSTERPYELIDDLSSGAYGLALSEDGAMMAAGGGDGKVHLFDTREKAALGLPFNLSQSRIWAVALNQSATRLAAGDQKGTIGVWDIQSGRLLARREGAHDRAISAIQFIGAGETLISGGADGNLRLWTTAGLEPDGAPLSGHSGGVTRFQLSPDGSRAAAADRAGAIRIWDLESRSVATEWQADDNTIWSVQWSPEGNQLATAHADEMAAIWDARTGKQQYGLTPHAGGATDVTFLSDGITLASTSRDGAVRLWDRDSGLRLGEAIMEPGGTQWRLVSSRYNNQFATTRTDGTVALWDILDTDAVCRRLAWDDASRRRYLGENEQPRACSAGQLASE